MFSTSAFKYLVLIGICASSACYAADNSTLAATITIAATQSQHSEDAEVAKQLANPVANLVSLPIQYNQSTKLPGGGHVQTTVFQPVIPFSLGSKWLLITRTLIPLASINTQVNGQTINANGLGDIQEQTFFAPKQPIGGWILGVGPAFNFPTASDAYLGSGHWGMGASAVALQQRGGWTYGMLASQMWSFQDANESSGINSAFLQPFISYTTSHFTNFGADMEASYAWNNSQWTVPFNYWVQQMFRLGGQLMALRLGAQDYTDAPPNGPHGWGFRVQVTFIFPKG